MIQIDFPKNLRIVLASASPRRKEIMEKMGLDFDIYPSDVKEEMTGDKPEDICMALSGQKALDVASGICTYNETHPDVTAPGDILVIGADTIVVLNDASGFSVLGKPEDEDDAFRMLKLLQDNTHTVYTGITFVIIGSDGRSGEYSFYDATDVTFYPVTDEELWDYIHTGEPMDKAGAYGIQGAFLKHIKGINGDYYNVMGLPASKMYNELKTLFNGE
ncbi:MAG: Maf family protein [Lachnospiraceae bacterium]|nr:Maf family protein [Lachnospiraceae bacterium]